MIQALTHFGALATAAALFACHAQDAEGPVEVDGGGGAGGSSEGPTGAGRPPRVGPTCTRPAPIALSILADDCAASPGGAVDGVFTSIEGGFRVDGDDAAFEMTGEVAAIPDGTLVHVAYGCNRAAGGRANATIEIDNLDTFGGAENPTEPGSRLWLFLAAGGDAEIPASFPFAIATIEACSAGVDGGHFIVQALNISGSPGAVIGPGEAAIVAVEDGPNAGEYEFTNVDTQEIVVQEGGPTTHERNLRVRRPVVFDRP